jgi:hypothetical protein
MFNDTNPGLKIWTVAILLIAMALIFTACSGGNSAEMEADTPSSEKQVAAPTETSKAVATEAPAPTDTPQTEVKTEDETEPQPPEDDLLLYEHNMDCTPYNDTLTLKSFSILYPPVFEYSDCRDKPNNYVVFEYKPGTASEFIVFLSKMNIDADENGKYMSNYVVDAKNLLDMQSPQLATQLNVKLVNDQPMNFNNTPYHRRDYLGEISGNKRLVRVVMIPNFETGQGLAFMALNMVEGDIEAGIDEFENITRQMIDSVAFSPETASAGMPESANPPEMVVQTIFDAAQSGDFAPLKDLCDPLGENDDDTQMICEVATDETHRASFVKWFTKGKVTGDAEISPDGSGAEVPFLFGPDGDQAETMVLINRDGVWYLLEF